jgi:diguanylate cyclase (GGDEF)-like protein
VKRFVRASIKGWIYALDHIDETVDYLHKNPASFKSKEHLLYEAKTIRDLVLPDYVPIGQISESRWEKIAGTFKKLGLAPEESQLEPGFFPSYWDDRSARHELWSYIGGATTFLLIVSGIGLWYTKVNRRLKKLIVEKNTLLSSVEELANHDFLTGLPSRRLIYDRIERSIKSVSRKNSRVAVCLIDLNGFKKINDEHGHLVGDQVLIEAAKRLSYWVREFDSVGRMGGDEFLICMEDIKSEEDTKPPIARLKKEFELPFLVGHQAFKLSFSIGTAIFPEDGNTPDELINIADQNMYRNKRLRS